MTTISTSSSPPPPPQAQPAVGPAPRGSTTRWRSESRTVRGSYDDDRSRSRSVKPFGRLRSSSRRPVSKARNSSVAPATGNGNGSGDLEKGKGGDGNGTAGAAEKKPWYARKFKSPLEPLLKKTMPMWLEGYIWGWIGGVVGVGIPLIVFTRATAFTDSTDVQTGAWTSPAIIGSFGASAVLLFGAPMSPLSQPRSFFFGQTFSAVIGVCVTKLFATNSAYQDMNTNHSWSLVWAAGAIATGTAILVQQITRTIHPPGGATAVLAATSPPIVHLGWRYIPVVMLTCAIMLVWAYIWINLGRRSWPTWWFFPPEDVRKATFPGPELGVYTRKAKQAYRERQQAKKRSKSILPVSNAAADGKVNDGDGTAAQPAGAAGGSEWQDETAWNAGGGVGGTNGGGDLHSGTNGHGGRPEAVQERQGEEGSDDGGAERQSRWARG